MSNPIKPVQVIVVECSRGSDDDFKSAIHRVEHLSIVAHTCNVDVALQKINDLHPDLVFVDDALPLQGAEKIIRTLREEQPDVKIMALARTADKEIIKRLLNIGVDGYFLRSDFLENISSAVTDTLADKAVFSLDIVRLMLNPS